MIVINYFFLICFSFQLIPLSIFRHLRILIVSARPPLADFAKLEDFPLHPTPCVAVPTLVLLKIIFGIRKVEYLSKEAAPVRLRIHEFHGLRHGEGEGEAVLDGRQFCAYIGMQMSGRSKGVK